MAAEARALCCLFILTAQVWSQVAYKRDWSDSHWVGIGLFSTWTVIAVVYRVSILIESYMNGENGEAGAKKTYQHNNNDADHINYNHMNGQEKLKAK